MSDVSVLKILLRLLSSETVTEEFETELCNLWDLTYSNRQVCELLVENKLMDIAISTLAKTDSERVQEILLGILVNTHLQLKIGKLDPLAVDVLQALFLNSESPHVLMQLTKLYHSILSTDPEEFINRLDSAVILERILFVLKSSTNTDLLGEASRLLNILLASGAKSIEALESKTASDDFFESLTSAISEVAGDEEVTSYLLHSAQVAVVENRVNLAQIDDEIRNNFLKLVNVTVDKILPESDWDAADLSKNGYLILASGSFLLTTSEPSWSELCDDVRQTHSRLKLAFLKMDDETRSAYGQFLSQGLAHLVARFGGY